MSCYWREWGDYTEYPDEGAVIEVDREAGRVVDGRLRFEAGAVGDTSIEVLLNREQVTHLCSQLTRALESWK